MTVKVVSIRAQQSLEKDQNRFEVRASLASNKVSPAEGFGFSQARETNSDSSLYTKKVMKWTLVYHRCLGTFHLKTDNILIKIYDAFMLLCMFFNFFKDFTVFKGGEKFDKYLVINICFLLWLGVNAIHSAVFFYLAESSKKFPLLISKADKLLERIVNIDSSASYKRTKRVIIFLQMVSVSIIVSNIGLGCLSYFGPSQLASLFETTFTPFSSTDSIGQTIYYKLFVLFLLITSTFGWASYFILFLSNLVVFKLLLSEFNDQFESFVRKSIVQCESDRESSPVFAFDASNDANSDSSVNALENFSREVATEDDLEYFRLWNLELGSLLRTANDCFKEFLAVIILFYGPLIFLILFIVSNWSGNCVNGILAFAYPFWLIAAIVIMGSCLHFSSQINTMAQEPLKELFKLPIKSYSISLSTKLQLMTNRLIADPTGLTPMNVLLIDKEMIVDIIMAMVAYFLIISKFRGASSGCETTSTNSTLTA